MDSKIDFHVYMYNSLLNQLGSVVFFVFNATGK